MELNIDRLHDVIEGKVPLWRGSGQTTAMLVQALQSAEVQSFNDNGVFAVIGPNHLWADMMMYRARDIAQDMGMPLTVNMAHRRLEFHGDYTTELRFLSVDKLDALRGKRLVNYYFDKSISPFINHEQYTFLESRIERE